MVYLARVIDGATAGFLSRRRTSRTTPKPRITKSFALISIAFGLRFFDPF
jgi:hypothetical protein